MADHAENNSSHSGDMEDSEGEEIPQVTVAKSSFGRMIKPKHFGSEWVEGKKPLARATRLTKQRAVDYELKDILEMTTGEDGDTKLLIKWAWPNADDSYVSLKDNPQLWKWIEDNEVNPYSCTFIRKQLADASESEILTEFEEIQALKQCFFDKLGGLRTVSGDQGYTTQRIIQLPFGKMAFDATFGHLNWIGIENRRFMDGGNKKFKVTVGSLCKLLGNRWYRRDMKNNQYNMVDTTKKLCITWEYKKRIDYNHKDCKRYVIYADR